MLSLRVHADREGIGFALLSGHWPHGAVAQAYGVFDPERGCPLRGTIVIEREGLVHWGGASPTAATSRGGGRSSTNS
ncbi:MAG TPA: redoxin domain-containing protein, partial [Jiangellaceae bacterium]|nr:redoxin domain-containing protein [Jiangellaceae bacterium]